jgi:hypothetical protein
MSANSNYQISRVVVAMTVPAMCYELSRIIPAGLNGDTRTVVRWFVIFGLTAAVGVVSFVVMIYAKSILSQTRNNEAEILAQAAADMAREKQAAAAKDPARTPDPSPTSRR